MKKLDRVDIQVSILTFLLVVISCFSIFTINYKLSYDAMIHELQERTKGIHAFLEARIDETTFSLINTAEDMDTAVYKQMKSLLDDVRLITGVRYLYTAKKSDEGEYIYLVDGLPPESDDFRNAGDPIEEEIIPDMERALGGEIVMPEKIMDTSWGHIFISYFPIRVENEVIGAVGIEFDARAQYLTYRNLKIVTPCIIILFCSLASLTAVKMFRRISNPTYRDFANTDMLTGLANRNAFDVMVHNLGTKKKVEHIAFISIDFDGLKSINDTLGHDMGDEYIRTGIKLVQEVLGREGKFYRTGGDEFVAVFTGKDTDKIDTVLTQIEKKLEKYNQKAQMKVQFSMGSAVFDEKRDNTLSDTLKQADQNMYHEKKRRKNHGVTGEGVK